MNQNSWGAGAGIAALMTMGSAGSARRKYAKRRPSARLERCNQSEVKTETSLPTHNVGEFGLDILASATLDVVRIDSHDASIHGFDGYQQVGDVTVSFPFGKWELNRDSKALLDNFARQLAFARGYILEVTGGVDTAGSAQYNHALGQHRAETVVEYLIGKYHIPPHRIYLVGNGQDHAVAGQVARQNRDVTVQLLRNESLVASVQ